MYYSLIALFFLAGIVYVQGQCPPKQQDIQMIIKFLEKALESVKSKSSELSRLLVVLVD